MRLLTLIFTLFLSTSSLFAYVGKVSALKGDVRIQRGADEIKAFIGSDIEESDTIITTATSRAQLYFKDDTVISIGKNSTFKVEGFFFDGDPQNSANNATFKAVKGAFKVMTGQIGKVAPESFKLSTRTATIGIRGTHFLGDIAPEADQIACTDGKISVATLDGLSEVLVKAGQITFIVPGEVPTPPREFSADELKKMTKAATNGGGNKSESKEESGSKTKSSQDKEDEAEEEQPVVEVDEVALEVLGVQKEIDDIDQEKQKEEVNKFVASFITAKPDLDYEFSWVYAYTDATAYFDNVNYGWEYESVAEYISWYDNIAEALVIAQQEYPEANIVVYKADKEALPDNNEYTEWGSWEFGWAETYEGEVYGYNEKGYYLTGTVTPETTVQGLIDSNTEFTYSGSVIGSIERYTYGGESYTEEIVDHIASGTFNATVDFGADTIEGSIAFTTTGGNNWNATISSGTAANIEGSYFSSGYSYDYGENSYTTTQVDGAFYGPNAEAIGGEFYISRSDSSGETYTDDTAIGVFEAKR